ncbi:MAG: nitronate monooxygenase [Bacteroidota bacterium]
MQTPDFSANRIARLFGIRYPLVQAGMVWCSGWELAAAVSAAGGLGLIGAGSMDADTLRIHVRKCRGATERPFGVNVPLLYRHADALMRVIAEENVPIVFTSAGNPKIWTPILKEQGRTVVHVVSSVRFAEKAAAAGVDALVAEGFEAGGHNGREELTTLVLVPQVRAAVEIPVIAAGGIATGSALLACLALGAEGVQMGTRFVASAESSAHPAYKQHVVATPSDGTQLVMKRLTPVRLIRNGFYQQVVELEAQGASAEELRALLGRGRSRRGMFEGDLEDGELEIGQISGAIADVLPAQQIVEQVIAEYQAAVATINAPGGGLGI